MEVFYERGVSFSSVLLLLQLLRACPSWRPTWHTCCRETGKSPSHVPGDAIRHRLRLILATSDTHQSPPPAPHRGLPSLQAWLLVLLVVTGRSQSPFYIAGGILVLTVVSLPPRLWKAQIKRLGLLALFLYVTTALFAGQIFLPKYSPPPVLTFSLIWLVNVEPTRVKSKLESI